MTQANRSGPDSACSPGRGRARRRALRLLVCAIALATVGTVDAELPAFHEARAGYQFRFPEDFGPKHGFRTAWWYYTGFLDATDGRRFGFQFTIFQIERAPNPGGDYHQARTFFMAHMALTDESARRYYFTERIQRQFPGMADAAFPAARADTANRPSANRTVSVFVEANTLDIEGPRHRLRLRADQFSLDLDLSTRLGPVIHGHNGLSVKGPDGKGSHYFSLVDLEGTAVLRRNVGGKNETLRLRAHAWMDREFGSNVLSKNQSGWDWLHITLRDGRRYMLFQVRAKDGGAAFQSGSRIAANGRVWPLGSTEFTMTPREYWTSPTTGGRYPVAWDLRVPGLVLRVRAWLPDQEGRPALSRVSYWEGALDVTGIDEAGRTVAGLGYLELTGYVQAMDGVL